MLMVYESKKHTDPKRMEEDMEEFAKACGFESAKEMNNLVCEVDLSNEINLRRFEQWKREDGTKTGFLKVIDENKKGDQ